MVYATGDKIGPARLRVGMVGGGRNAFIGAVHRMALRLDDRAELVAGALSSDPEYARVSGADIGIAEDRAYSDYRKMAEAEAKRPDGTRRSSSSRRTICTRPSPAPSSKPASTSSATSRCRLRCRRPRSLPRWRKNPAWSSRSR